jgi:hypothetical protein
VTSAIRPCKLAMILSLRAQNSAPFPLFIICVGGSRDYYRATQESK